MLLATASCRRAVPCIRLYSSALNGNRSPLDNVTSNHTPALSQEDALASNTEEAFELRVPGVVGMGAEANVAKPGTVDWPNPSEELLKKVPIAKVTHDGDVTTRATSERPPGDSMPRN